MKLPLRQGLRSASQAERLTESAEARLVLVIDQLEELFTLDILTSEKRGAFVAALEALARSRLVWVVATMRSDFFDRLDDLPALARLSAGEARYLLTLPDAAEIGQIVRQPTREAGLYFEFDRARGLGLDDKLCEAAAKEPSALPLLEFTLDQLWQRRTESGELTFAAYQELGGLEGALGRRAKEEFSSLRPGVQAVLPQVLRALATVGQGVRGAVTARAVPLSVFAAGSPQRELVEAFLAPKARLLVVDGDDAGARVRVAHEALLTHWERARDQLLIDRSDLQTRARLEQAASLWQTATGADRASRLLPTGLPIAEAEDLLQRRRDELDSTVIAYIEASTAAVQAQAQWSRWRLQATVAVFAVLALVAGITAFWAVEQRSDALAKTKTLKAAIILAEYIGNRELFIGAEEKVLALKGGNDQELGLEDLLKIMPTLEKQKADMYLPYFQEAMNEFDINTPLRKAAFLAYIADVTNELKYQEQSEALGSFFQERDPPSPEAKRWGNTQPGDGKRFKGRGPLFITGRRNYKLYGEALGVDLISKPELASTPQVGSRMLALYWKVNGMNLRVDAKEDRWIFDKTIYPGQRANSAKTLSYYKRAKETFGIDDAPQAPITIQVPAPTNSPDIWPEPVNSATPEQKPDSVPAASPELAPESKPTQSGSTPFPTAAALQENPPPSTLTPPPQ